MTKYYCGIDIGKSGAIAFISEKGNDYFDICFKEDEEHDIAEEILSRKDDIIMCCVEKVHSMPGQGVASTFKFGDNNGWWRGVIEAAKIPFEYATPQKWQKELSCLTKGDKNVTKRRAMELFPLSKIKHANADAYLIAKYCRDRNR